MARILANNLAVVNNHGLADDVYRETLVMNMRLDEVMMISISTRACSLCWVLLMIRVVNYGVMAILIP